MIEAGSEEQPNLCGSTSRHKSLQPRFLREELSPANSPSNRQLLDRDGLRYSNLQHDGSIDALLVKFEKELADMHISNSGSFSSSESG